MKTKYTRVVAPYGGAYGMANNGIILAQRGESAWLLTDNWCGGDIEGYTYRQHVAGHRRSWPKAAEQAADRSEDILRWTAATRKNPELCDPRNYEIELFVEALAWLDAQPAEELPANPSRPLPAVDVETSSSAPAGGAGHPSAVRP